MKKFLVILVALMAFNNICNAQLMTSRVRMKAKHHNVWLELSAGYGSCTASTYTTTGVKEQFNNNGFDFGLNVRWTKPYGDYFAWDILNFGGLLLLDRGIMSAAHLDLATGVRGLYTLAEKIQLYAADDVGLTFGTSRYGDFFSLINELSLGATYNGRVTAGAYFRLIPKTSDRFQKSSFGIKVGFSF